MFCNIKIIGKYCGIPLCTLLCGCLESFYSTSTSYSSSSFYDDSSLVIQKIVIKKSYKNKQSKTTIVCPGDTIVVYFNALGSSNSSYVELTVDPFGYVYDARYFDSPFKVVGCTSHQ